MVVVNVFIGFSVYFVTVLYIYVQLIIVFIPKCVKAYNNYE